ncbi:MAG: MBL fold metallo-hydrolase [Ignavibacteriaceae bacterium]|nr:MBL fold metallo-hydrolase [Ignavibacteriaceae bacterium]
MKLQFLGAAQEVTGSQHLLLVNGKKILIDCGMFQGRRKEAFEKNRNFLINPSEIDILLLTHAHIDHSGNIPTLVSRGFTGDIYTTTATLDLCQIMLRDSAHIQVRDVMWVNKKRKRDGKVLFEPLYAEEDVDQAMSQFIGVQYNRRIEIAPGVHATFRDAGHILGSSGILLEINENGKETRLGFTGDIGRKNMPILKDPNILRDLDTLVIETTYGNRVHSDPEEVEEDLAATIRDVIGRGGKIITPAFAVGRTQALVYILHKLWEDGRIPAFPIYVDSPLAVKATEVFRMHPECFDRETNRIFMHDKNDPFGFGKLKYIQDVEESKALNGVKGPFMIISASGMAEAGRVLHHMRNNIQDSKNLLLFVGYAAEHTLARKLMDGAKEVNILGDRFSVKCEVKKMDYFSGHADKNDLLEYLKLSPPKVLKNIFLVHGEEEQALPFMEELVKKGYQSVQYPVPGQKLEI